MAGYRRRRADGATPAPLRVGRPQRRRTTMAVRMASARTPLEKYTQAQAYLRSALGRRQPDPEWADRLVADLTQATIDLADELLAAQAREPLHHEATT